MKNALIAASLLMATTAMAAPATQWVTVDAEIYQKFKLSLESHIKNHF